MVKLIDNFYMTLFIKKTKLVYPILNLISLKIFVYVRVHCLVLKLYRCGIRMPLESRYSTYLHSFTHKFFTCQLSHKFKF